jgi:hypothetical protein
LAELDYALHFIRRLELIPGSDSDNLERMLREASRILQGLWTTLKRRGVQEWDRSGPIGNGQEATTLARPASRFLIPDSSEDTAEV